MVTAQRLINCSNTLCNIYTKARENIKGARAKLKAGYFFMAHPVYTHTHTHTNGSTNFTKIKSHLKILGARNVI